MTIHTSPTNNLSTVYLADTLFSRKDHAGFAAEFTAVLEQSGTPWQKLIGTRDIWARDYMPVEVAREQFVQFVYRPSYLLKSVTREKSITDGAAVFEKLLPGAQMQNSHIKLDGGNLLLSASHALITDRVFTENEGKGWAEILGELDEILQREIVILPAQHDDEFGHADGMVRFLPDGSVLMNAYQGRDLPLAREIRDLLEKYRFTVHTLVYHPDDKRPELDATGIYMNYLLAGDCLFVSAFGGDYAERDAEALETLSRLHPGYRVFPVNCSGIARLGGLLHCVSWTRLPHPDRLRPAAHRADAPAAH